MNEKEKDQILITQIILMFQTAALQQMGKLKNPLTDRIERDMDQARISIDILEMLHRKMQSNLTGEEERIISGVLRELRLNFVDEAGKPPEPPPAAEGDVRPPDGTPQEGG